MNIKIKSEQLAYWYLRLNGFLSITNFIVHPDFGGEQRTDVDIVGVRFPHRAELLVNPMQDDRAFCEFNRPYIIIAEVKRRECNLNGPWVNQDSCNMQRVLRAIGALPQDKIDEAADSIYEKGFYSNDSYFTTLCCFGETLNPDIEKRFSSVPQKLWDEVLRFIFHRFRLYPIQKASLGQWGIDGRKLWDCYEHCQTDDEFIDNILIL